MSDLYGILYMSQHSCYFFKNWNKRETSWSEKLNPEVTENKVSSWNFQNHREESWFTPEHKMSFKKILSSSYGKSNLSIHRDYILVSEDMRELALSCRWCMGILGQCVKMLNMHTLYCNTSTPKEECIKKFLRTCFVILKIGDTLCPTTSKASQS